MSQTVVQASLTVLAPVREGELEQLKEVVARIPRGADSPFARVASTHFARFVIVPSLLDGDGEPIGQRSYLLFTADFDGARERWIKEIAARSADELDGALGHCDGYPGSADAVAFRAYLDRHDVGVGFSVISYTATVERIHRSLERQHELRALAARASALSPGELQDEWRSRLAAG